jgi:hypothetical protein
MISFDHGDGVPLASAAVADDSYRNDAIGRTLAKMLRHREDKALDGQFHKPYLRPQN